MNCGSHGYSLLLHVFSSRQGLSWWLRVAGLLIFGGAFELPAS